MPTAYYVCPVCRQAWRTRYPGDTAPEVRCAGRGDRPHAPTLMTYRGDGWRGRRTRMRAKEPGASGRGSRR